MPDHSKGLAIFLIVFASVAESYADANSSSVINDLASMLHGEFESRKQMEEDRAASVPKELQHAWVNRTLFRVNAPEVGETVFVATTSYIDPSGSWYFDEYEFLVLTLVPENDGNSVRMFPRRLKQEKFAKAMAYARDPEKLATIVPEHLEAAISGSNCEIIWVRNQNGFSGNSKPCRVMSTTKHKMLDWTWSYELGKEALWIEFSGVDDDGKMLDGSPRGAPYRLDRVK